MPCMHPSNEFTDLVNTLKELPESQRHIRSFVLVRDMAYGDIGSRDPYDVLEKKKGTCSGKHALLKLLLEALGYEVKSFFARHNFGSFPLKEWPQELEKFQDKQIIDYHDFLKVKIQDHWITIDAMFDPPPQETRILRARLGWGIGYETSSTSRGGF
jgi:hypothetical protein